MLKKHEQVSSNTRNFARRPPGRTLQALLLASALGIVPAIAYADFYSTPKGDYTVEPSTNGGYIWTAENGEGGKQPTKREAKRAAKKSLKKKPAKSK